MNGLVKVLAWVDHSSIRVIEDNGRSIIQLQLQWQAETGESDSTLLEIPFVTCQLKEFHVAIRIEMERKFRTDYNLNANQGSMMIL